MFPFSLISIFRLRRYYVELKALQPPYWVRFGDCMCQAISSSVVYFPLTIWLGVCSEALRTALWCVSPLVSSL